MACYIVAIYRTNIIQKVAEMFGGFVEMYYLCNRK